MKIAIVGTGISGLVASYLLSEDHDITVYEAANRIGGHTNTVSVELEGRRYQVDTGFIVYNEKNYPNFVKLINQLGVASQPTSMSFSVRCEVTGLEYNGTSLNQLFAQRSNLLRPSFYRMIRDILRFNRDAKQFLKSENFGLTFEEFLEQGNYSYELRENYAIPMTSAIWSGSPSKVLNTPFYFIARFYENHGMLNIDDRPQWRVIKNGSSQYVTRLVKRFENRIRLQYPVSKVIRSKDGVEILSSNGDTSRFDNVFLATHSDQALDILENPSTPEKEILGAIQYQNNEAVLHWDDSLLPKKKLAWAGWNYHKLRGSPVGTSVTYNMNILQGIDSDSTFCVSLNMKDRIDPAKIIKIFNYDHPVFSAVAIGAQKRLGEINGTNRTYFCGAYWGSGFHEDGVNSALNACRYFGKGL
ncbi:MULTISPECIES: NAD(P)/FAD-dependent oxidoreductase [unclassified Nitrospina]|uniref:NAD(P)/FAD-dependent oxidoreductase n=1 Tax=unclassified Nitrospina TaxID=2638683 RepID=UPI003F9D1562